MRLVGDVHRAVTAGRDQLRAAHPADADVVMLINGDMATESELSDCMAFVRQSLGATDERLERMDGRLERMEENMKELKTQQPRTWLAVLVLLGLAALGQWVQPWLAAAVAGR
jgi:hypothetical protein